MNRSSRKTSRTRVLATLAILVTAGLASAGKLATKPGAYEVRTEEIKFREHKLDMTLVKPVSPRNPVSLILFATGDAGWMGASGDLFEHMAERGYYLAAFNSKDVVKEVKSSSKLATISGAAEGVDSILVQAKKSLGFPETTPVIVTGFSRGATLVVFTAGVKSLQRHVEGAVAIALTRESDFLQAPEAADRPSALHVDDKGRMQTYPAIELAGPIPFAVIQSKGDKYVPAEEARRLFGQDTPTRRLYEVDARNHGFGGGQEELIRDLDDALQWIEKSAPTP
jgi:predicted alpha/beta hydrolase family esterase